MEHTRSALLLSLRRHKKTALRVAMPDTEQIPKIFVLVLAGKRIRFYALSELTGSNERLIPKEIGASVPLRNE